MKKYLGLFATLIILWTIIVLCGMVLLTKYDACHQNGHGTVTCIATSLR